MLELIKTHTCMVKAAGLISLSVTKIHYQFVRRGRTCKKGKDRAALHIGKCTKFALTLNLAVFVAVQPPAHKRKHLLTLPFPWRDWLSRLGANLARWLHMPRNLRILPIFFGLRNSWIACTFPPSGWTLSLSITWPRNFTLLWKNYTCPCSRSALALKYLV